MRHSDLMDEVWRLNSLAAEAQPTISLHRAVAGACSQHQWHCSLLWMLHLEPARAGPSAIQLLCLICSELYMLQPL